MTFYLHRQKPDGTMQEVSASATLVEAEIDYQAFTAAIIFDDNHNVIRSKNLKPTPKPAPEVKKRATKRVASKKAVAKKTTRKKASAKR